LTRRRTLLLALLSFALAGLALATLIGSLTP